MRLQARAECEELRRELGAAEARGAAAAEAARRVCREAEAMVGEREAATQHGRAGRLWAARHSQGEAQPLGAPPLPWVLEPAASKAADFTLKDYHSGGGAAAASERASRPEAMR
eukprot:scaffold29194_cov52-Phaeocystis_antarctica.AAC.2